MIQPNIDVVQFPASLLQFFVRLAEVGWIHLLV
jgi:hypothetical protein